MNSIVSGRWYTTRVNNKFNGGSGKPDVYITEVEKSGAIGWIYFRFSENEFLKEPGAWDHTGRNIVGCDSESSKLFDIFP